MKRKRLITVVSDSLIKSGVSDSPPVNSPMNLVNSLRDRFNVEDLMFYSPSTITSGAPGFLLHGNEFRRTNPEVESDALLIFSVNSENEHFGINYIKNQFTNYANLEDRVGRFMNPLKSKFLLDKGTIYDLDLDLPLPEKYEINSWNDLAEIIEDKDSCILKHIMGAEGAQVYRVTNSNFNQIKQLINHNLNEYIAQEFLDSNDEKRIVIFGDDVVAARIIHNRNHPWDSENLIKDGYHKKTYTPTREEIEIAMRVHKHAGMDFSATDFLSDGNTQMYLETNGICPGLVTRGFPIETETVYNLNTKFVDFIYDEISKN